MKCPICGNELRPSKKDPAYGLCDNCRKKFKLANLENTVSSEEETVPAAEQQENPTASRTKKSASGSKTSPSGKSGSKSKKSGSSKNGKSADRPEKSVKSAKSVKAKKPADTFDFDDDFEPKKKKKKGGCFKFLLIFILIIAIAGAACFFLFQKYMTKSTSKSTTTTEESTETTSTNSSLSGVGSSEEQNNVKITLVNATESTGGDYTTPSDGNIFLVCEFEVVNNSEADININSLADIEAYCGDYSVSEDITGLLLPEAENKNSLDGTVAAGETLTGVAVYQVPADYSGMEFRVFPEAWSEAASFKITNQ